MAIRDKKLGLDSIVESRKPTSKRNTQQNKRNKKQAKIDNIKFKSAQSHTTTGVVSAIQQGLDNPVNKITSDFVGATITISNPHQLVDTDKYPTTRFVLPTSYSTTISRVINDTTFELRESYKVQDDTVNDIPVSLRSATNNATITYETFDEEQEDTIYQRSYADLTIGNLKTFSGDVYKAKIYARENGSSTDFEEIYETIVTPENSLVDKTSINSYEDIGFFHKQNTIDNYWVSSSTQTTPSAGHTCVNINNSRLVDGALISGSVAKLGHTTTFRTKNSFDLEKGVDYQVKFNSYYFKDVAERRENDETITEGNFASLKVYISGSAITGQNGEEDYYLGEVDIPESSSPQDFVYNVTGDFKTANTGSPKAWLKFELNSGRFIVQNVSVEPFNEVNFNPNFFKVLVPLPKQVKRGASIDFLVEFYDSDNNKSEISAQTNDTTFIGPRQVLADGLDGIFSGSMVIGQSLQMYGVNPAYIRTVGYQGFDKTIAGTGTTNGGFLLWSGSVGSGAPGGNTLTSSEAYNGVGMEVVDASAADSTDHKFFQFASNHKNTGNSKFRVQTDEFFLGKKAQFISGSNGNIVISSSNFFLGGGSSFVSGSNDKLEISSSNFHLDNNGDVTLVGEITAEAGGTIGGFLIGSSSISKDNVLTISSSINTADPASFISSSAFKVSAGGTITGSKVLFDGGEIGGFEVVGSATDVVDAIHSADKSLILSGSGHITASNAQITGNITATSGKIGSFNIGKTLSGTNLGVLFSDSNELVITGSTGQITGSKVLFDGGKIGGFTVDSTTLANGTDIVLDAGNKKITLDNGSLVIDNNSGTPVIRSATNFANGDGFFLSTATSNNFRVGDASAARLQFTGTNTEIYNSSNTKLVSLGASNTIAGWTIDSDKISSNNLILHSDGFIETTNYASNVKGFFLGARALSDGSVSSFLEVDDARIRGTLSTTVFEKETINAVGGQLHIANSTTITGSAQVPAQSADTLIQVANSSGFVEDEFIIAKKFNASGFTTEIMKIKTVSHNDASSETNRSGSLLVERQVGQSDPGTNSPQGIPDEALLLGVTGGTGTSAQTYQPGQVLVSTGKINTGYIRLNANPNDTTTPYIDIIERHGTGVYDMDLKVRLGDLSGLSTGAVGSSPGFGLFTDRAFLTKDVTIGTLGSEHILIGDSSLVFKNGSDVKAQLDGNTWTLGGATGTTANAVIITANDVNVQHNANNKSIVNSGGFNTIVNSTTGSIFDSTGATIYGGSSQTTASLTSTGLALISNGVTGSLISQDTASMFGSSDKHERTEMVGDGLKIYQDNVQVSSFGDTIRVGRKDESHQTITSTQTQFLDGDGSTVRLQITNDGIIDLRDSGGNVKVQADTTGVKVLSDNTTTFGLFNASGVTLVDNNVTSSIFDSTGVTIYGGESGGATASLDANDISFIVAGTTGSLFSALGAEIYGASDKSDRLTITDNRVTLIANNITGSLVSSTGVEIYGASDKAERLTVTSQGISQIANNVTGSFIDEKGVEIYGASNKSDRLTITDNRVTHIFNNVTGSLFDSTGATIYGGTGATASLDANDISFIVGGVTGSSFSQTTASIFGVADKQERVEIVETGLKVYQGDSQVASFGANTTISTGATIGAGNSAQIVVDTVGGDAGITVKDADNNNIAFIGNVAGISSLGSGGAISTTNAIRGVVTDGLTANEARITGSLSADSGDIAKITGDLLTITGSANVGGLVASGSVRNTSNGAATAVMIHVADNSNTYFQVLNDGEVLARDNITAFTTGFTSISDKRLKEDVYPISNSLNKIVKLEPSHFTWIEKQEQDIGFIAQEVEEIIPEVIHETKGFVDINSNEQDDTTYKSISYDKLTVYLVGAVKELTKRIEDLEERFIKK